MSVKKNLEELKEIIPKLKSNILDEQTASDMIHDLGRISRDEVSSYYNEYLNNDILAENIVMLGNKYSFNTSLMINLVSLLGNLVNRYHLPPTDDIFNLLYNLKDEKKVNFYVSLFLTSFPQFWELEEKWDYILSIPKIAPKKTSEKNFYFKIDKILKENIAIPFAYKKLMVEYFEDFLEKDLHEVIRSDYIEMINRLK